MIHSFISFLLARKQELHNNNNINIVFYLVKIENRHTKDNSFEH